MGPGGGVLQEVGEAGSVEAGRGGARAGGEAGGYTDGRVVRPCSTVAGSVMRVTAGSSRPKGRCGSEPKAGAASVGVVRKAGTEDSCVGGIVR